MVDRELHKDVMARFASGVVVVTTNVDGGLHGVTLSSFSSLSLDPPLVLVCVDRAIQTRERLSAAPAFAVNILSREQTFFAEQFAGWTPLADPTFSRVPHDLGASGAPLIRGCLGWIECRPWATYDGGDHVIVVGEITGLALGEADDPLVYFDREFTDLAWG